MTILSNEGFVRLVEAMMSQAREDLKSKDEVIRKDAEDFIARMQKDFS